MSVALHMLELRDLAQQIKHTATENVWASAVVHQVHNHADEALKHISDAENHYMNYRAGDAQTRRHSASSINSALTEAVNRITSAHQLVSANMGADTPSDVLQVAHLGEAHQLHQNITEELNEGLKNGS